MRAWLVALLIVMLSGAAAQAAPGWRILRDHWTPADEEGYGRFVAALGATNCSSSESCLRNPANPWRGSDQHFMDIDVDCAKLPYLLRAYYAWKNGLPFSYVSAIQGDGDTRYNARGNRPAARHDMVDAGG